MNQTIGTEMPAQIVRGFSKLSREEKLDWLKKQEVLSESTMNLLRGHLHPDSGLQSVYDTISENTVSNYYMPFSLAPNFLIDQNLYILPMVIEESSVVAAASHAARFWAYNGGFHARVRGTRKTGQIHFTWGGELNELARIFEREKDRLAGAAKNHTRRMEARGGGILEMELKTPGPGRRGRCQIHVTFETSDAMGANFVNSVLESMAAEWQRILSGPGSEAPFEILMSILSNYTPECLVECHVEGKVSIFDGMDRERTGAHFARRFKEVVNIACQDPYRAVTHNKGIFNGMDAVILATGNDFRAAEANGHAYASRNGSYTSLSKVEMEGSHFRFSLEVPLAIGTVGGVTGIHPLASVSLEMLDNPSAEQLMKIIAAAGLATNFSAVRSLITTGIQAGHMKMHLANILMQLNASREESEWVAKQFRDRTVSFTEVSDILQKKRKQKKGK